MAEKQPIGYRFHPGLIERVEKTARQDDMTPTQVIEWALAEFLSIPYGGDRLWSGPVLCPVCRRGVLWNEHRDGNPRCGVCRGRVVRARHSRARAAGHKAWKPGQ
jgi:hypothetical protein